MSLPKIRRVNPAWIYAFRAAHGLKSGVSFTPAYNTPDAYIMMEIVQI